MPQLSTCHRTPVAMAGDTFEGTEYYVCTQCHEPCGVSNPPKTPQTPPTTPNKEREYLAKKLRDLSDGYKGSDFNLSINFSILLDFVLTQRREAAEAALNELLEWGEYWNTMHTTTFNWHGAIKALLISKDFKKPFIVLPNQDNKEERG